MLSISFTLCCVGLVFSSPAVAMNGTSVRCAKTTFSAPSSRRICRIASMKRKRFDIAHCAADFDEHDVDSVGYFAEGGFDFIGDVRDYLHRLAEIIAPALFGDDGFVDAAGGPIMVARKVRGSEALVMAEIEIGFGAVVGHEHFAVLIRRHRAGIDVQVRIALLEGDAKAAAFEKAAHRSRCYAFSERRNHAAGYEDVLRADRQGAKNPPVESAYEALSAESLRLSNRDFGWQRAMARNCRRSQRSAKIIRCQ